MIMPTINPSLEGNRMERGLRMFLNQVYVNFELAIANRSLNDDEKH